MVDPGIIQAGIQGVGSALNSVIGNNANMRAWREQAEYNSPINQMARLKQAGLNPHLLYGSGSQAASGNQSAPRETQPFQLDLDWLSKQGQYQANKKTAMETQAVQKQIDVFTAEILAKNAQTAQTLATTARTKFDLEQADRLKDTVYNQAEQNLLNSQFTGLNIQQKTALDLANTNLSEAQKNKIGFEINEISARVKNINANTSYVGLKMQSERIQQDLLKFERSLNQMGFTKSDPYYIRIMKSAVDNVKQNPSVWNQIKDKISDWWSGDSSESAWQDYSSH